MATQEERIKAKRERALSISRGSSGEPIIVKENYDTSIASAFSYYNVHSDKHDKRKWLLEHFADDKEKLKLIRGAPDFLLRQIAVIARLLARDQYVSDEHQNLLVTQFVEIEKYIDEHEKDEPTQSRAPDKNAIILQNVIGDLDDGIDSFCTNKVMNIDIAATLAKHDAPNVITKKIAEYYVRLQSELQELLEGKDEQLVEGWSFLSKLQQKLLLNTVTNIIDTCRQAVANKKPRKERAKKVVPPAVLVSKMKYMKEISAEGVNLKSIAPVDVLKSKELWVYNTKTRILAVYRSKKGLQVKGTTLLDWDVKESTSRRLRKPEVFFAGALAKASMNDAFTKLTTVEISPNGRINADMILVKAF